MSDTQRRIQVEAQLNKLGGRDLQLWTIGFLVMIVLALAVVSSLLPAISGARQVEIRYIPQIALGLIALVLLLNFYLIGKNRELNLVRRELVHQLAVNDTLERYSLIDPETELFTRGYLSHVLPKECKRGNRSGNSMALVVLDVLGTHAAPAPAAELARAAAVLFKSTFRGTDTLLRLEGPRFLVIMPETNQEQAHIALNRLQQKLDDWNLETRATEMLVHYTVGSCPPGGDAWAILRRTEEESQRVLKTELAAAD